MVCSKLAHPAEVAAQVCPFRVSLIDQFDFPGAVPFFHLALPGKGLFVGFIFFVIDQAFEIVFFRETFENTVFMLVDTVEKVICVADIQHPVFFICDDVDVEHWA